MAGVPVESVAVLMGHRSPAITLKYYSAWVAERAKQLEASVERIWAKEDQSKLPPKGPKQTESAIQTLYGNRAEWLN